MLTTFSGTVGGQLRQVSLYNLKDQYMVAWESSWVGVNKTSCSIMLSDKLNYNTNFLFCILMVGPHYLCGNVASGKLRVYLLVERWITMGQCKDNWQSPAIAGAVSHFPVMVETCIPSQASPCGICGEQTSIGTRFFPWGKSKQSGWAPKPVWMLRKRKLTSLPGMVWFLHFPVHSFITTNYAILLPIFLVILNEVVL
jgi:hypothetical protein